MQSQLQITENGSLLAVNRDNPNEMVIFNAAGIGVSDDGGNTFPNAITGKGVVAEAIYGNYIFGVNIASANGDGWFHVSGSRAEFHSNSNGRYVHLSPNGLFGYNANGNVRFQADQTLVTSSAFGTSVENVYLAAYGEARVVNYDDIPGDGQVGSYRYLPLRASNLFADSLDVNVGTNLYLRTYSNGEVRITNTGSTSSYRPLRASNLYGDSLDTNSGGSVYIRPSSNGSAHVTATGTTNNYRPIYASEFRNGSSVFYKTNIRDLSVEALPIINNLEIKEFVFQEDVDNGVYDNWQVGLISELSPEASSPDGKSINLYKLVSYSAKAIQELSTENERLKKEVDDIYLILGGE